MTQLPVEEKKRADNPIQNGMAVFQDSNIVPSAIFQYLPDDLWTIISSYLNEPCCPLTGRSLFSFEGQQGLSFTDPRLDSRLLHPEAVRELLNQGELASYGINNENLDRVISRWDIRPSLQTALTEWVARDNGDGTRERPNFSIHPGPFGERSLNIHHNYPPIQRLSVPLLVAWSILSLSLPDYFVIFGKFSNYSRDLNGRALLLSLPGYYLTELWIAGQALFYLRNRVISWSIRPINNHLIMLAAFVAFIAYKTSMSYGYYNYVMNNVFGYLPPLLRAVNTSFYAVAGNILPALQLIASVDILIRAREDHAFRRSIRAPQILSVFLLLQYISVIFRNNLINQLGRTEHWVQIVSMITLLPATIAPFFVAANTGANQLERFEYSRSPALALPQADNPPAPVFSRPHSPQNESRYLFFLRNGLALWAAAYTFFDTLNLTETYQHRQNNEGSSGIFMAVLAASTTLLRAQLIRGLNYTINQRFFAPFPQRTPIQITDISDENSQQRLETRVDRTAARELEMQPLNPAGYMSLDEMERPLLS